MAKSEQLFVAQVKIFYNMLELRVRYIYVMKKYITFGSDDNLLSMFAQK